MPLTILEGSTFCVCDESGDVDGPSMGFFASDTRFLSRLILTVNGARPLLLTSGKVEYYSAAFFLRNPIAGDLGQDEVSIARERFVGEGMQDHVIVRNHAHRRVELEIGLEVGADFADILTVKEHDFTMGDPRHAPPLPPPVEPRYEEERNGFVLRGADGFDGATQVFLSERGEIDGGCVRYRIALDPGGQWRLRLDVLASATGGATGPRLAELQFGQERTRVKASLAAWQIRVPQLEASWPAVARTYERSVADLASLRMGHGRGLVGQLPAAGMPWFMTVFGRDTIITCLQTLLFGPELAESALAALVDLQATEDDPATDAEPGKIVHEVREGRAAKNWFSRYYGSVDATPLFLVLLSEVWRWTDDAELLGRFREPALRALGWIDRYGDSDGDGFVEYERRAPHGLENQSWKDSGNSQLFSDGRRAEAPIAPCEVQGYVYDAKLRLAEIARIAWGDEELATRLEREAADLRRRFDESFWCETRGGYYALALDGRKERVDSLASNIGHLLWSGIVPEERVAAIADRLMQEELWSGWGVRTMSTADAGYSPLMYHNGTVWPHDNSLIAVGLARCGHRDEADRIVRRMTEAAAYFDYQLPEVFAGFPRSETPFPIAYPTAARPQAWAAGTPILLLQVLLGLEPDRERRELQGVRSEPPPEWAGRIRLSGIRAFDSVWHASLEHGEIVVRGEEGGVRSESQS